MDPASAVISESIGSRHTLVTLICVRLIVD
jgi:hypothetical protein